MKHLVAALTGTSWALASATALACPQCASRGKDGASTTIVLGLFILFPFVVSAIVYRVIRSGESRDAKRSRGDGSSAVALPGFAEEE